MSDWQTGVPPVTGWYDVIWDGDDAADVVFVHAFTHDGRLTSREAPIRPGG